MASSHPASPPKRRRVRSSSSEENDVSSSPLPSNIDIWKWTLTKDAIAPCFVRDVLEMRECAPGKDVDYFWLRRLPCRTVTLVGIVVGVNPYEKRTVYAVDDGSGVIECSHRITTSSAASNSANSGKRSQKLVAKFNGSPRKLASDTSTTPTRRFRTPLPHTANTSHSLFGIKQHNMKTTTAINSADTHAPIDKHMATSRHESTSIPKPSVKKRIVVGSFVRVQGRVNKLHDSRQIIVQDIDTVSANEELKHWEIVRNLHKTRYNPDLGLFSLPSQANGGNDLITNMYAPHTIPSTSSPTTPTRIKTIYPTTLTHPDTHGPPSTPKRQHIPEQLVSSYAPSLALNTPSSQVSTTDGSESEYSESSPRKPERISAPGLPNIKLRHPSRLHSRDLTANTFRIYLKYYMDHAFSLSEIPQSGIDGTECVPSDEDVSTPRKPGRQEPSASIYLNRGETPRPSKFLSTAAQLGASRSEPPGDEDILIPSGKKGFTLSFLRRVPELAYLARRVVEAEGKRRAKEERDKARLLPETAMKAKSARSAGDHGVSQVPSGFYAHTPSQQRAVKLRRHGSTDKENVTRNRKEAAISTMCTLKDQVKEESGPKMKRLFTFAIRKLYDEGSIIIWDGPIHSCTTLVHGAASDELWKMSSKSCNSTQLSKGNRSTASAHNTTCESVSMVGQSRTNMSIQLDFDEDEGLSDPREDEEAYISLTSAYLAPFVEDAIEILTRRGTAPTANTGHNQSGRNIRTGSVDKNVGRNSTMTSHAGPSQAQITSYLQRTDARWARIGEWSVGEALELLNELDRVWVVSGQGTEARWEKCL